MRIGSKDFCCKFLWCLGFCRYKWYKNGTLLDLEAFDERIKRREGEGTISFTKVSKEDEGDYVCKASNDNGTAVSETVSLQLAC